MARITIEDLSPDTDLTPEELELIYGGAGRRSFRPTIDSLEVREMYAANLGSVAVPGLLGPGHVKQAPLVNELQLTGLGNTSHFQGLGGGLRGSQDLKLPPGVQEVSGVEWGPIEMGPTANAYQERTGVITATGEKYRERLNADGSFQRERWYKDGAPRFELQAFDARGNRIAFGRQEGGSYLVETYLGYRKGMEKTTERYDKAPELGGRLQSFDGNLAGGGKLHGEWQQGKLEQGKWVETTGSGTGRMWVETTTGSANIQTQTDIRDKPELDGSPHLELVRLRNTTYNNGVIVVGQQKGDQWVETTTGEAGIKTRTRVTKHLGDGDPVKEVTYRTDGSRLEFTTESKRFQRVDDTYDKNGYLVVRKGTTRDGLQVEGERQNGKWVETTTGLHVQGGEAVKKISVYGSPDGKLESTKVIGSSDIVYSETKVENGRMTVKMYHQKGYKVYFGIYKPAASEDAHVTWVYSLNTDGTIKDLEEYKVEDHNNWNRTWSATWVNPHRADGDYRYGWTEHCPYNDATETPMAPPSWIDGGDWTHQWKLKN